MVRNIDYPEAIVLYGPELSLETSGLIDLLEECRQTETPVLAIGYPEHPQPTLSTPTLKSIISFYHESSSPPNPKDLWEAINSIEIQPQPFGGSSGFGAQQLADPPRPPLPARVVVFGTTLDQTRAARATGTRIISLQDNHLADAVVTDLENLWLEDLATPGSFWLNPPQPRDDEGNRVSPEQMIKDYVRIEERPVGSDENQDGVTGGGGLDEDEMLAILADIAPL